MSTDYKEVDVKCPYFRSMSKYCVRCEGIIPESTVEHHFRNVEDKDFHLDGWCCDKFEYCESYEAINKNYEGD